MDNISRTHPILCLLIHSRKPCQSTDGVSWFRLGQKALIRWIREDRFNRAVLKENRRLHHPFKLKLVEIVEAVESAAFKRGMPFAAGLVGGSCVLCERCVGDKFLKACRHPFRARPSMEAVGIDVVKTAQNAGLPIHLSSPDNVLWTGLILLD